MELAPAELFSFVPGGWHPPPWTPPCSFPATRHRPPPTSPPHRRLPLVASSPRSRPRRTAPCSTPVMAAVSPCVLPRSSHLPSTPLLFPRLQCPSCPSPSVRTTLLWWSPTLVPSAALVSLGFVSPTSVAAPTHVRGCRICDPDSPYT
jgi:hypothetical protein